MDFPQVSVVGRSTDQSPATLRDEIEAWVTSEALAALVAGFGGEVSSAVVGSMADRLDRLDAFSTVWDYRALNTAAGQVAVERNQAVAPTLPPEQEALAMAAARALGLVVPNYPRYDRYDHVLVNGALVRYSIWRTAYAGLLLRERIGCRTVASLTAHRQLSVSADPDRDEPSLILRYRLDPAITDESEMMEFLLRREFGLGPLETIVASSGEDGGARFSARGTRSGDVRYTVVTAPNPRGVARANTGETMAFWAGTVERIEPGERVLSISSAIYGPYQHADALRTLALPYGVEVDTVAIDFPAITGRDGVPDEQPFGPDRYLQEIRSTIRAYRALWIDLDDRDRARP